MAAVATPSSISWACQAIGRLPVTPHPNVKTPIQATIDNWEKDVMLVSHLPFVALLTAALTGASETHPPVAFTPGTAIALQPDGEGNWQIVWMIRPDLLP